MAPKIHYSKSGKPYFIANQKRIFINSKLHKKEITAIYKLLLKKAAKSKNKNINNAKATVHIHNSPSRRRQYRRPLLSKQIPSEQINHKPNVTVAGSNNNNNRDIEDKFNQLKSQLIGNPSKKQDPPVPQVLLLPAPAIPSTSSDQLFIDYSDLPIQERFNLVKKDPLSKNKNLSDNQKIYLAAKYSMVPEYLQYTTGTKYMAPQNNDNAEDSEHDAEEEGKKEFDIPPPEQAQDQIPVEHEAAQEQEAAQNEQVVQGEEQDAEQPAPKIKPKGTKSQSAKYGWYKRKNNSNISFEDFLNLEPVQSAGNKHGGLYNDQIDRIMSRFRDFKGCIMRDQIKNLLPEVHPHSRVAFIINTDPHDKPGKHWQAIYIDARDGPESSNSIEFYDSFGRPMPPDVKDDIRLIIKCLRPNNLLKLKENNVVHQSDESSNCGWFCCRFLIDRFRNQSFASATGFDDKMKINMINKNEKEIEKMKNTFNYIDV